MNQQIHESEATPEEVYAIAREVEYLADHVEKIAWQIARAGQELDGGWIGTAKTKFFLAFDPLPRDINNFSKDLKGKATQIKVIRVIVQVVRWVEDQF